MNDKVNRYLNAAGLIVAPLFFTLAIVFGVLEQGYSHLTKPMSILGGVPGIRGLAFNIGVIMSGVLVILFAIGLWRQLPSKMTAKVALGLLMMSGLGMVGSGYFHCSEGCRNILIEPNLVGRLHTITALLTGIGTGFAPLFVWLTIRHNEKWKGVAMPTLLTAILANIPGITFWVTLSTGFRLVAIEGLLQRLGLVFTLIWIFFISLRLWWLEPSEILENYQ